MNPLQPPIKPLPTSQTRVQGLPLLQKRSIRIINNTPQPQIKRPKFGAQRQVATYVVVSTSSFDELAKQVADAILQGLTPYGSPIVLGAAVGQALVTWI